MRLNFSASPEDELREGIRRIGAVIHEQVELYETITQPHTPGSSASPPGPGADDSDDGPGGEVVPLPRR